MVGRCRHWRTVFHDPIPSPCLYLHIKINSSSKIVLLPGVSHSSLITLELEAISFLLSIFLVYACNASSSFPVDCNRNLNVALLGSKETTMPCSQKHPVTWGRKVATVGSHLQSLQLHINLQILTCWTLPFYFTVSDPALPVSS